MTAPSHPARYPAWGTYFTGLTKDLSPQEVLDKLKISQTMVSRWAKGSARPQDIAHAKKVATTLGGNPEDAERAIRADTIKSATTGARSTRRTAKKTAKRTTAKRVAAARQPALNGRTQHSSATNPLDRIRASRSAIQQAERDLDEAVNAARSAGVGWPEIATALG